METLPPPLGGDVNRGQTFIILVAVLGFVSVITTVLRVGVRIANHQQGWDDYTIALATLLLLIQVVLSGLQYHAGIGRHMVYLSLDQNMDALKWSYVTILLFFVAVCLTKVSICLFILRIKKTGWLKWVLYTLMTGLVITTAAPEIILFMQCQPIRTFWDRRAGTCWKQTMYDDVVWAQAAYAMFSDLTCSLLPVVVLWNIKIDIRLKIGVCCLMSLGLIATACATVRASVNKFSKDLTWSLIGVLDWGCAEENLGIIAANLAVSRTVYLFFRDGPRVPPSAPRSHPFRPLFARASLPPNPFAQPNGPYSSTRRTTEGAALDQWSITKTTEFEIIEEPSIGSLEGLAGAVRKEIWAQG